MSKTKRPFLWGCLTGGVLTVVLLAGGTLASSYLLKSAVVAFKAKKLSPPPITLDEQADYDWSLTDAEGAPYPMQSAAGKTVVLHFWHPDCVSCLAEIETLNQLWERMEPEGMVFLGVGLSTPEKVADAAKQWNIQFPVYPFQGARPKIFQATAIPATYILSPDGRVVFKHMGGARWDEAMVMDYLRRVRDESAMISPAEGSGT